MFRYAAVHTDENDIFFCEISRYCSFGWQKGVGSSLLPHTATIRYFEDDDVIRSWDDYIGGQRETRRILVGKVRFD